MAVTDVNSYMKYAHNSDMMLALNYQQSEKLVSYSGIGEATCVAFWGKCSQQFYRGAVDSIRSNDTQLYNGCPKKTRTNHHPPSCHRLCRFSQ